MSVHIVIFSVHFSLKTQLCVKVTKLLQSFHCLLILVHWYITLVHVTPLRALLNTACLCYASHCLFVYLALIFTLQLHKNTFHPFFVTSLLTQIVFISVIVDVESVYFSHC